MSEANKRILFLCAHRSVRALMAASLLTVLAPGEWDIWITPGTFLVQDLAHARHVLDEVHIPLLTTPQTTEPTFDQIWDDGIVICSGAADQ